MEKRLILGNAWPSDIFLLRDLPGDYSVTVVPHQLSPEIILAFQEGLKRLGRLPVEINDATSLVEKGDTFIINKKGVLCELYSDFGKAYVGGGFETSIHSVLEPLVAGSDQLAAGPMHHRSTEYDIAMELELMSEVRNPEAFKLWLAKKTSGQSTLEKLTPTFNLYPARRKEIILC